MDVIEIETKLIPLPYEQNDNYEQILKDINSLKEIIKSFHDLTVDQSTSLNELSMTVNIIKQNIDRSEEKLQETQKFESNISKIRWGLRFGLSAPILALAGTFFGIHGIAIGTPLTVWWLYKWL